MYKEPNRTSRKKTSIEIIADESQLHKELVNWKIWKNYPEFSTKNQNHRSIKQRSRAHPSFFLLTGIPEGAREQERNNIQKYNGCVCPSADQDKTTRFTKQTYSPQN